MGGGCRPSKALRTEGCMIRSSPAMPSFFRPHCQHIPSCHVHRTPDERRFSGIRRFWNARSVAHSPVRLHSRSGLSALPASASPPQRETSRLRRNHGMHCGGYGSGHRSAGAASVARISRRHRARNHTALLGGHPTIPCLLSGDTPEIKGFPRRQNGGFPQSLSPLRSQQ